MDNYIYILLVCKKIMLILKFCSIIVNVVRYKNDFTALKIKNPTSLNIHLAKLDR